MVAPAERRGAVKRSRRRWMLEEELRFSHLLLHFHAKNGTLPSPRDAFWSSCSQQHLPGFTALQLRRKAYDLAGRCFRVLRGEARKIRPRERDLVAIWSRLVNTAPPPNAQDNSAGVEGQNEPPPPPPSPPPPPAAAAAGKDHEHERGGRKAAARDHTAQKEPEEMSATSGMDSQHTCPQEKRQMDPDDMDLFKAVTVADLAAAVKTLSDVVSRMIK